MTEAKKAVETRFRAHAGGTEAHILSLTRAYVPTEALSLGNGEESAAALTGAEVSCTSVLAAIAVKDRTTADTLSIMTTVAPRPPDAAGIGRVCRGSLAAVQAVLAMIGKPAPLLLEIESVLAGLDKIVARELLESGTRELAEPVVGCKGKYPQWSVLADLAAVDMSCGARLAAGVELLRAWKDAREISKAATVDIAAAIKADPLSNAALRLLLDGIADAQDITSPWQKRLQRSWRQVVRHFGEDDSPIPPANVHDRARGQILESSVFASPTRRAGASNHRQLSKLQLKDALAQIGGWIDSDDFRGTYGFMACCTGFTADLIPLIPLQSSTAQANWVVIIDVAAGCLKMDVSSLAEEAARASMTSAAASNFVCIKPLPQKLAALLRARLAQNPDAHCLGDLYPGENAPQSRDAVIRCPDEIKPSWARLRRSCGTFMRQIGIDNLLACVISGDFGHVPRSKSYYACVEPHELLEASRRFFQAAGWDAPVSMPVDALAFGCRVVPSNAQIRGIDQWWENATRSMAPAKHCALAQVLEHHNRFMKLTGFRLALVFALREQVDYCPNAEVDERVDRWLAIDDKHVPGLRGALPVPLTQFAAKTIGAVRIHCRALQSRLRQQGLQYSALALWCDKVVRRQDAPLLMMAASPSRLRAVGTNDCLAPLPAGMAIAPDFGRKLMENALRSKGLKTGDIDAVLRHSVLGQSKASAVSDFNLLEWLQRVTPVMDQIAADLLGNVYFGLVKE